MMKSVAIAENRKGWSMGAGVRLVAAIGLCILGMALSGCGPHPGETVAEVNRRHDRVLRLNNQMLLSDLDKVFMLDKPSRLTDKRLP